MDNVLTERLHEAVWSVITVAPSFGRCDPVKVFVDQRFTHDVLSPVIPEALERVRRDRGHEDILRGGLREQLRALLHPAVVLRIVVEDDVPGAPFERRMVVITVPDQLLDALG